MPRAPKACGNRTCDTRIPGHLRYCPDHERPRWAGAAEQGRSQTRAEQDLARQVLLEEPWCVDCLARGVHTPSAEAGHIVAAALGGPYVRDNLVGQCRACNLDQLNRDRRHPA